MANFINLIQDTGLSKQQMDGVVSKNVPLNAIIKNKQIQNKGKIEVLAEKNLHTAKAKVRLHKQGDLVLQIEFVCSCGETAIIELDYDEVEDES